MKYIVATLFLGAVAHESGSELIGRAAGAYFALKADLASNNVRMDQSRPTNLQRYLASQTWTSDAQADATFTTATEQSTFTSVSGPEQMTFPGQSGMILTKSGPLRADHDGQIIENLWIEATGSEPAVAVAGYDGVVIRNVVVHHRTGPGLRITDADDVLIENVHIVNDAAPSYGPHAGTAAASRVNIIGARTTNLRVTRAYLEKGSSGIYLLNSTRPVLTEIQGFDFRGPLPRGQLVQFDKCTDPVLDTFSVVNPGDTAWTEDVVNSFGSWRPIIRNGYIEGVNSPTGVGVIIENGAGGSGGLVENVDVRYWVNGAFMAATGARTVTFRNVRAYDGLALAEGSDSAGKRGADGTRTPSLEQWAGANFRGAPTSGQQAFFAYKLEPQAGIIYVRAGYSNLPFRKRIAHDTKLMQTTDFYVTRDKPQVAFEIFSPEEQLASSW